MLLEMNKAHYRERGGAVLQILIFLKKIKGEREGGEGGGTQKTTPSSVKKTKTEPGCDWVEPFIESKSISKYWICLGLAVDI